MPAERENRFLLLYGSQTGQAKAIAEELAEKASRHNLHPDLHCLSLTEKKFFIEREKCIVIITSTTGDGEPPDTALKFVRRLKKKTLPDDYLSHLNYALLGLGDSNYTNFCNCGKSLDHRLQELGARRFYDCGWADDAVGLEVAVEPWLDGLLTALKQFLHLPDVPARIEDYNDSITCNNGPMNISNSNSDPSSIDGKPTSESDLNSKLINRCKQCSNQCECDNLPQKTEQSGLTHSSHSNSVNLCSDTDTGVVSTLSMTSQALKSDANATKKCSDTGPVPVSTSVVTLQQGLLNQSNNSAIQESPSENSVLPSLRVSVPPLSESTLSVPVLPQPFLNVQFHKEQTADLSDLPYQNGAALPSAASPIVKATVTRICKLTHDTAVKKTLLVELNIPDATLTYQPGDAISVVCHNNPEEVNMLLSRLGCVDIADTCMEISVLEGTKKKNASVPNFLPTRSTLRHVFTTCLDIREPPKKALLRVMVDFTHDEGEKRRLQELCSKQGSEDYAKYLRESSLSVLDVLNHFPSCQLPVHSLFEHLPRLQPRPYSVCSSALTNPGNLQFCFNVVEMPLECGRTYYRQGVCTGWLDRLAHSREVNQDDGIVEQNVEALVEKVEGLHLEDFTVPIFTRTNQHFRPPEDVSIPLILIGPGTGVAPFIGFLDERGSQREKQPETLYGDIWLFYGCRHRDRDFLFRDKMEQHRVSGCLTKLLVSVSRDEQPVDSPRYVQDSLRANKAEVVKLIEEKGALVYVCGDAKNMAKDVNQAFIDAFSQVKGISMNEASKLVMKLQLDRRYREDVWT